MDILKKLSLILFISIITISCNNTDNLVIKKIKYEEKLKFGINTNIYKVQKKQVVKNDNISSIMNPLGINATIIDKISKTDSVFDSRKIKAGNNYYIFTKKDSTEKIDYIVYSIDRIKYVIYNFKDSLNISIFKKPVIKTRRRISGTITSSLWNSFVEKDEDPLIANELSEIYAWTIDFFGIQKGDKYTIVFDEITVDSNKIGIGTIYSVLFNSGNKDFYALRFYQDSAYSYFDEKGNSLKKAFLKAPLKYSRISSGFTNSRFHPVLKIRRPHHGVDYAAATGTPVYTIGDGKVISKGWTGGGGNTVKIKHNSVYITSYMHLSKYAANLKEGDRVKQGEVIGYVGSTGLATGPHLDFRVYKNSYAIDPLKMDAPPSEPIKKENIEGYNKMKKLLIEELNNNKPNK